MRNFPVMGFPSSCGDVQPQRTSLVIRTEHNLFNKNKIVEQWRGNRTVDLCICFLLLFFSFFLAKTGFLMMWLINNFISDVKCALHAWVLHIMQ